MASWQGPLEPNKFDPTQETMAYVVDLPKEWVLLIETVTQNGVSEELRLLIEEYVDQLKEHVNTTHEEEGATS